MSLLSKPTRSATGEAGAEAAVDGYHVDGAEANLTEDVGGGFVTDMSSSR